MNFSEIAVSLDDTGPFQLGILAKPEVSAQIGVVIMVGGPQYRAGSHRQFVLLSRALAQAGFAVLRIDYQGMGDSEGVPYQFTNVSPDIARAIDALQTHVPTLRKIALWGLCDAASAALIYLHDTQDASDTRVVGLCLLNPWVRSEASLARTQVKHYYTQRLRQREFWVKLASGRVAASAVKGLITSIRGMRGSLKPKTAANLPFQDKMQLAWRSFRGSVLLILSGEDYTAKEFLEYANADGQWSSALKQPNVHRHDMKDADHTFSDQKHSRDVETATIQWLTGLLQESAK
jgi:uncharacterized protein